MLSPDDPKGKWTLTHLNAMYIPPIQCETQGINLNALTFLGPTQQIQMPLVGVGREIGIPLKVRLWGVMNSRTPFSNVVREPETSFPGPCW